MSAAAPRQPEIGDRVHVWIHGQGCHPGTVDALITDSPAGGTTVALQIKTDERVNDCPYRISRDYDAEMQASGSWHWPHDHQPSKQPSLNIEALVRLDLRPDEILAVTLGVPDLTVQQCPEFEEYLDIWLAEHGQPVAGVLVLPQGSQLAAIRPPKDETPPGTLPNNWGGLNRAEIREALESAASIKHLREGYGV